MFSLALWRFSASRSCGQFIYLRYKDNNSAVGIFNRVSPSAALYHGLS